MWILLVFINSCSGVLIEGDIAVPSSSTGEDVRNSFLLESSQLWSDGIVPYLFETLTLQNGKEKPLFSDEKKQMIRNAMFHISGQVPCLEFGEISTGFKGAHLIFSTMGDENNDPSGCWAYVGCLGAQGGKAGQTINLGSSGCFTIGTVLHEIMHSLGATHEQNREDRQAYVNVLEDNIQERENRKNFQRKGSLFSSYGTPYDYASIMHYADDAFAVPGTKTIVPRQPNITLIPAYRKSKLSPTDTLELAYVYGNLTKQDCHMKDRYVDLPNGPKCEDRGLKSVTKTKCKEVANALGYRGELNTGNWSWAPFGCFAGNTLKRQCDAMALQETILEGMIPDYLNFWDYLYYNTKSGQTGRPIYRTFCNIGPGNP